MDRIQFIYGNQPLEIKEKVSSLIRGAVPKGEREHSVFYYDAGDFYKKDQAQVRELLADFQNTCETVSFFSSRILIYLRDLQKIPNQKNPTEKIEQGLSEINFILKRVGNEEQWFDASSLSHQETTHHHITGKQLVTQVHFYGGKVFYLELIPEWQNRIIFLQKGRAVESVELTEYLSKKLKGEIHFKPPHSGDPVKSAGAGPLVALLKEYIASPPDQVSFIFSAEIKKTNEINKEIYKVLQKQAKTIKTTIAYDDFRPVPWVIRRAKEKGINLNNMLADLLIEIAGADFSILDTELAKLSLLLPSDGLITPELLIKSVSHSKKFGIFRVSSFLVERNLRGTVECLQMLLGQKAAEAVAVFGVIASQFRRLLRIAWMLDLGTPDKAIITRLKMNPWIGQQLIRSTRNFSVAELENIVIHLSKLDLQTKYSAADAQVILENLCFQICQGGLRRRPHLTRHWLP